MNILTYVSICIHLVIVVGLVIATGTVLFVQDKQLNALNLIRNTSNFTFKLPRK